MAISASSVDQITDAMSKSMRSYWGAFLFEGIVLVLLGMVSITLPTLATLGVTIVLGWVFLIGGIVGLIATFRARNAPGFWWSLFSALLAITAGVVLFVWPDSGAEYLTMILIIYFFGDGLASIMYSLEHKRELTGRWGWLFANGVIDVLLAGIILYAFPGSSQWLLGLLVGIDMIFGGFALVGLALEARTAPAPMLNSTAR